MLNKVVFAYIGLLLNLLFSFALAQTNLADLTQKSDITDAEKIYGLSLLWKEASYNFVYFDQVPDLNWDQTYIEYIPKVLSTKTTLEYYEVLQKFYALLKDGHTQVYPPKHLWSSYDNPKILIEPIQRRAIIVNVGKSLVDDIPIGSEIVEVNDIPTEKYLKEEIFPYLSSSTEHILWDKGIERLLLGPTDTEVKIKIQTSDEKVKELNVKRNRSLTDEKWVREIERKKDLLQFKWLENDLAYVAFNSFGDRRIVEEFKKVLPELYKCKGLLIDVRNNTGGSSGNAIEILKHLTEKPFLTSKWRTRKHIAAYKAYGRWADEYEEVKQYKIYYEGDAWYQADPDTIVPEKGKKINVPIVVLIGHNTASAAEDFLIYMDSIKRGIFVGQRTNGSTGQPLFIDLPGGGSARICAKRDTYPDGRDFVGIGIVPDVYVEPTVDDVLSDRDVILQKGIEVLKEKISSYK